MRAGWRVLLGAALLLIGIVEFALHYYFAAAAPRLPEWQAIRPEVERLVDERTLIVVSPEWAEPNARFALGDRLMPLSHVARPDASGFERALEISILGASAGELADWQRGDERRAGSFVLRSWTNPRVEPVLYDFLANVEPPHASVNVLGNAAATPCRFASAKVSNGDLHGHPTYPKRRFVCPGGGDWFFVGLTAIEDQHYRPRHCIWAHPDGDRALQIRFESVPLGSKIRGYGGLPYFLERESHGAPIELSVHVGDQQVGSWQHEDGEGWKPFEFSTAGFAGQHQSVEFRVQAKRSSHRQFCFQADVR